MNIVIIGGKSPTKLSDVLYSTFDDIQVISYKDTNLFMQEVSMRAVAIHRILLLQDGIDNIPDDEVYSFTDFIQLYYPETKLISLCKDVDVVKFMAGLFNGPNTAHFCIESIKAKMLNDVASLDIDALVKKYESMAYSTVASSVVEEIEEISDVDADSEENISGLIPNAKKEKEKRGLLKRIFGISPKEKSGVLKKGPQKAIGQSQGYEVGAFTEGTPIDFNENENNSETESDIDVNVFGNDVVDIGLGVDYNNTLQDEAEQIAEKYGKSNIDLEKDEAIANGIDLEKNEYPESGINLEKDEILEIKDEDLNSILSDENDNISKLNLEKEDYTPIFDLPDEEPNFFEDIENMNVVSDSNSEESINRSNADVEALKQSIRDVVLSDSAVDVNPLIPKVNLDDIADIDLGVFSDNMDELLTNYEESNKRVVEVEKVKVVERIVNVGGVSTFRNKNGVRILVITGDRRVGATKLAFNLANLYAQNESVLYVDFDRNRHGSLGYLDLENLLNEEEHIQNGLTHCKRLENLSKLVYMYKKGGFYNLLSMYGTDVSDENIELVSQILCRQQVFKTVIIDCPLENMYLLNNLIYLSHVLICGEDDKVGIINLLNQLSCVVGDEKSLSAIFDRSYFVVGRKGNIEKFKQDLYEACNLFDILDGVFDWTKLDVLGILKNTRDLARRLDS